MMVKTHTDLPEPTRPVLWCGDDDDVLSCSAAAALGLHTQGTC